MSRYPETTNMYQERIKTTEEAVSHLFFHCCFKDGQFTNDEVKTVSEKLVAAGLNKDLNFTDEITLYKSYRADIDDEDVYLKFLISLINPTSELALYAYCVELCISDSLLDFAEDRLLSRLALILNITGDVKETIIKLMIQRKTVEVQKIF